MMSTRTLVLRKELRPQQQWPLRLFFAMVLLLFILVLSRSVAQTQGAITLVVYEYDPDNPLSTQITDFTYMINDDNSGDPTDDPADCSPDTNVNYPDGCEWPSLTPMASYSPIVTTGDETAVSPVLANGRYLVSVRADGYKLGGTHFQLPDDGGNIIVELVPEPLPLSTIRVHAFLDNQPVDGEDAGAGIANSPIEPGLEGFRIILGDTAGEVSVDWYNNPLCSQYTGGTPNVDGTNVIVGSGGVCYTDAEGNVSIENMPRGKYEVIVVPPDGQENDWAQTTTIEGTHVIDAWVVEGDEGNSPREGFVQPAVWVGFVPKCEFGDTNDACAGNDTAGSGTVLGTVKTIIEWTPPFSPLQLGQPMYKPWIALSNIGATDQQVYLGRGNPDGSFQIDNVPDGTYQMAIWDDPLDYIIGFRTITIPEDPTCDLDANPQTINMNLVPNGAACDDLGGVGIPRWFGWTSGFVFMDDGLDENGDPQAGLIAGNGIRDCVDSNTYAQPDAIFGGGDWSGCERAMDGEPVGTRYRDGSIQYGTLTNNDGFYEFPEVKELEKYAVIEVGFGRYGRTGASLHNEFDPTVITSFEEGALTVQSLAWAAKRSWVDWGKFSYDTLAGENGGISGIVFNAVTRNETDIRFAGAEDYEPGIPNVIVNLYAYDPNAADGKGIHLMQTATDAWEHASGCDVTDSAGNLLPDPTLSGPLCIEVPNTSNEVKDGLFDGGYAFETGCFAGYAPGCVEATLPAGDYVVEVVPPAFYKVLEPGDENTSEGNALIPKPPGPALPNFSPPPPPTPGCDINNTGGCSRRLVTLSNGRNAPADFFLLPDFAPGEVVPMPGRIYGFALDDLNVETDPNRIYYGEKRGIPNAPIGLRDFTGRLVALTSSDPNGIFEVLLPSGIAADCPTPSGICPNVYKVVVNDPGDPDNPTPNFNPNYQTLTFQFDVWPGKTTFADVATFPITAFTEFPGGQFNQPAVCSVPANVPEVWAFNLPGGYTGDLITVHGANFDAGASVVTDTGVAVATNFVDSGTLTFTVPPAANGRYQLLVENGNGEISANGITFHKIGPGYNPAIIAVDVNAPPGGDGSFGAPFNTIQAGIDAASDGTIVVVGPGIYYEDVVLNKNVKLQGFGPGANDGFGTNGTVIDERFATIGVEVVAANPGDFSDGFNPQIDGFRLINARDEQDIGGGLHIDVNGQNVEISNNVIQSNGGNIGGGIVIGQPYVGDNNNDNIRIHHNRILNNGGFSRAGGIGIYNGADNYEIDHNDICGNYSGEYGGGISHFGLSHGGSIHHNRIYRNNAFDEGGGIMIAGEQINVAPGDPTTTGSGNVDIYNNLIQENMSNDDGGGIRLLQPWDYHITMTNNMVVNNVATDMGGGISIDDASDVEIVNNTIARNANTSTAEDSDGLAHAAGVNAEAYSTIFATYIGGGATYPNPVMFNNIICENQSYTYDEVNGVLNAPAFFDLEVFAGGGAQLDPRQSLLTDTTGYHGSNDPCGNLDALLDTPYELTLNAVGFNQEPNFVTVVIVTAILDGSLGGDYHLAGTGTVAEDNGVPVFAGVAAPCVDFDDDTRGQHDIGADEAGGNPGACGGGGGGGTLSLDLVPDQNIEAQAFADTATEVVLNHTLHNTGDLGDAYNLTALVTAPGGPGWAATVEPAVTGTIPPAGETTVTVTLSVPSGVISGTVATVEVTAVSQTNPALSSSVTDTITFFTLPMVPAADVYISREINGAIGNLSGVRHNDIIGYVQATSSYVMVFDASDVGVPNNRDLEAFDILDDGSILMSFNNPGVLPDVGSFDDSDIILFTPTALGDNTAGTFSMFLQGAAVGLTTNGEDIDGLALREGDQLLISLTGGWQVPENGPDGGPTLNGRDEDVLMYQMFDFSEPALGGTFSLYLDGSDVGLANGGNEDVNGVAYQETDVVYLSTNGNFSVPGLSGDNRDIFVCTATSTGPTSACTFAAFFDGSAEGIASNDRIDGFDLP